MISEYLRLHVELQWKKYNKIVCNIPKLNNIIPVSKEYSWCQFIADDLYNQKYNLYINTELEETPDEFIEQTLFHEFTHMADSITFLSYDKESFKSIMKIYSETHASKIQMDRILTTQKSLSLNNTIMHGGEIRLSSFMDQTFQHLIDQFNGEIFLNREIRFDTNNLYYFIGYLQSLKEHKINYIYSYDCIHPMFQPLFKQITHEIIKGNANYNDLIEYDSKLNQEIKQYISKSYKGRK